MEAENGHNDFGGARKNFLMKKGRTSSVLRASREKQALLSLYDVEAVHKKVLDNENVRLASLINSKQICSSNSSYCTHAWPTGRGLVPPAGARTSMNLQSGGDDDSLDLVWCLRRSGLFWRLSSFSLQDTRKCIRIRRVPEPPQQWSTSQRPSRRPWTWMNDE